MRSKLELGAAFLLGGTFLAGAASAQCPSVGNDTGCGAVITITATGAQPPVKTSQGPYDGSDDTLVGVVNNIPACTGGNSTSACGISIYSIDLTSGTNIFSFDGDGINSPPFNVPGNAKDNTGYGGPNAYFTNINSAGTSGRVNFITPIPPGGSSYFSLENVLTASSACTNILNNSVPKPATPASGDPIVQEDAIGIRLRDVIGVDNMMWGSDYPHSESTFPQSRKILAEILTGVPNDDQAKIAGGNTARV